MNCTTRQVIIWFAISINEVFSQYLRRNKTFKNPFNNVFKACFITKFLS